MRGFLAFFQCFGNYLRDSNTIHKTNAYRSSKHCIYHANNNIPQSLVTINISAVQYERQGTVSPAKPTKEQVYCSIRQCTMKVYNCNLYEDQVDAIYNLITDNLLLLSLKTGSGKSTVMQVTGCLLQGVTVVIVPLLVLGSDQR